MTVVRLRTRKSEAEQAVLFSLRRAVLGSGISGEVATHIATLLDREMQATSGWTFVMVEPELNSKVVGHIANHSRRPLKALQLWAKLFTTMPRDSNVIQASRKELAAMIGVEPRTVSELMGELAAIGAIYSERQGRYVRYLVNPKLGTHLSGQTRDFAQASAPPVKVG